MPRKEQEISTYINQGSENRTLTKKRTTQHWAVAVSPGSGCNPTGNEGCEGSSIGNGSGNDNSTPPRFPKPKGGSKPPGKGSNGDDEDMSCCADNREILKLILDAVGYHLSPIEVPKSLIDDDGEGKESVVIPNISSFVIWWFGRWDEVMGKYPQQIEIEDTDPLKEGKQKETVILSNQAEALTELYSQLVTLLMQQQIQINMLNRTMLTTGLNRESGIRNEEMLDAIIDYLGFNIKEQATKVNQLFTPNKSNWDEILDESVSKTKTVEIDTTDNLQSQLTELLQSAAIIRAVHFKQVNPNGDIARDLKKSLLDSLGVADRVKSILSKDSNWKEFENWIKLKLEDSEIEEQSTNVFDRG